MTAYGMHGEILPPPLVAGLTSEEALDRFKVAIQEAGSPDVAIPARGPNLEGMYNLALLYVHQFNLRQALAQQLHTPEAHQLHQAVVEQRKPLSLRPVGMEKLIFSSFTPIFQRIDDRRWRVGRLDDGRIEEIETSDPAEALEWAWQVFAEWSDDEAAQFRRSIKGLLWQVPLSLSHIYWANYLERGKVQLGPGLALERMHSVLYRLITAEGERFFRAKTPEQAARIGECVARQMGTSLAHPQADVMLETFLRRGLPLPLCEESAQKEQVWLIGKARARWDGSARRLALLVQEERRFVLRMGPSSETTLLLSEVRSSTLRDLVKQVELVADQPSWPATEVGKKALLMWATHETNGLDGRAFS